MEVDRVVALAQVSLRVRLLEGQVKFPDSVASIQSNPFTDSHAVSMLTDVPVDNLDRVKTSTYVDEATGGQLWTSFTALAKHADYGESEGAVVMDLVDRDQSVQHVVATFPTEIFSGDRTDRGGKISTMSNLIGSR